MKLFGFRGGVHPESNKFTTREKGIKTLPLPDKLYLPVQQHIGAPASPVVKINDKVLKGQLLAHSQGAISAPIHAPTSGTIIDIDEYTAPHPSGLPVRTIVLAPDGNDTWQESKQTINPFKLDTDEIAARVGAAGIVGMGGATFPSAVKLGLGKDNPISTLIINGGECEPYLTCDDLLMQEHGDDVIDGIHIMVHALKARRALIAIEDNKPAAIKTMTIAAHLFKNITIISVPSLYPMGSEKQMIQMLTGKEIPTGSRSADIGVVVHNVGTAYAVHNAIRTGKTLTSRIVTVGGGAVNNPQNFEVLIGTRVSELFKQCDGFSEEPARVLMGGPMMGQVLPHINVPIVKGSSGIIALTAKEIAQQTTMPCIRCGSCTDVCPCGLLPLEMANRSRKGDLNGAVDFGLMDCISCGSCAYVCPSHIPLVQYFNFAKGELISRNVEKQHHDVTRVLAEQRKNRLEAEIKAKELAAEKRKALREEKLRKEKEQKQALIAEKKSATQSTHSETTV